MLASLALAGRKSAESLADPIISYDASRARPLCLLSMRTVPFRGRRKLPDGRSIFAPEGAGLMSSTLSRLERLAIAKAKFLDRVEGDKAYLCEWLDRPGAGEDAIDEDVRSLAHRLRGTAGSYGFAEVSSAAADVEAAVHAQSPRHELRAAVETLLIAVEAMLNGSDHDGS